ncbi:DUF3015 family protein [Pseudidiomarina insulisalsae]|uniref:DUF3015 domain-containing protein n=1 Tax=Pseudidiomarina insulisalsae TaxID=575789 RepID=A0A432YDC4_9GAMM|nr:DUF3015 family protein [Pseudidiomarina insulisalsae]RUO59000.1 DUF3015 domain-containing protein [Pseudidiomarina insulisalsae]
MVRKLAVTAAAVLIAGNMLAAPKAQANAFGGVNPWQQCGIGAMIFPNHGLAAAISNIIWDLGTTAVTSATVSQETCEGAGTFTAIFVTESYVQIEEQLAVGDGEHLNAMLQLMGCTQAQQPQAIKKLRTDYAAHMGTASYSGQSQVEKAEALYYTAADAVAHCQAS